jgi:hypothetical protein
MTNNLKILSELKSQFVTRAIGDELVIVPLTGNVAKMNELFTLNATGKFIWENVEKADTVDDLVGILTDEFDIDTDKARNDVASFLHKLETTLPKVH